MKSAVDNAFLNFTANIVAMLAVSIISLWLTPYLIGKLGVEVYGVVPLFLSTMTYLGLITAVLSSAVNRFVSLNYFKGDIDRAKIYQSSSFWGILGISVGIILLSAVFSLFLDKVFNIPSGYENQTRWLFLLIIGSSLIAALNSTYSVSFFIQHKFYWMDIFNLISRILQVAVIVLGFQYISASLVFVGWGCVASALSTLLLVAVMGYFLMPALRINYRRFDWKACREMANMGFGVIVNQFGAMLYLNSDLIVINILLGSAATGQYGPIVQWAILIRMISVIVTKQFGPIVMELVAKEDYKTLLSHLCRVTNLVGLMIGLPACLVCGFSVPLLKLWLGPDFVGLYKLMMLLVLGQILPYSMGTIFGVFQGLNTLKIPGRVTLLAGVLNIVVVVILIKYTPLGIYGAGISTLSTVFGKSVLFNVIYLSRLLKFNPWKIWSSLIRGCLPAIVFTGILFVFSRYVEIDHLPALLIYGTLSAMVYCVVVYRLSMNKEDRRFGLRVLKLDKFISPQTVDLIVK